MSPERTKVMSASDCACMYCCMRCAYAPRLVEVLQSVPAVDVVVRHVQGASEGAAVCAEHTRLQTAHRTLALLGTFEKGKSTYPVHDGVHASDVGGSLRVVPREHDEEGEA